MLDNQTRDAIDGLFQKLGKVERQGPERDPEAENLIRARVASQPGAPYYMAQTIVVQEQALEDAQRRIEELEARTAGSPRSGGGLLSSIFGGAQRPSASVSRPTSVPTGPRRSEGPWQNEDSPRRGGGFLAGAAQTAMGVAGGVLLGNAVAGMFGGNEAQAADAKEPAADEGGGDFFGGDEGE